ncbi:MAG TPA: hypothetical protein VGF84_14515 [Micromonosporaceae bacterium]|jgi:hypothetical protein
MESRPLILAVIDAFLLLEMCGEDEIDRETAERAADNISASLKLLRHDDQVELREQLDDIAETAEDETLRGVVAGIADQVGLAYPHPGEHLSWR